MPCNCTRSAVSRSILGVPLSLPHLGSDGTAVAAAAEDDEAQEDDIDGMRGAL